MSARIVRFPVRAPARFRLALKNALDRDREVAAHIAKLLAVVERAHALIRAGQLAESVFAAGDLIPLAHAVRDDPECARITIEVMADLRAAFEAGLAARAARLADRPETT